MVKAIYEQLTALELAIVDHQVLRLQDDVSFVHVATPPNPTPATIIGSYTALPTANAQGR